MKKIKYITTLTAFMLLATGCGSINSNPTNTTTTANTEATENVTEAIEIEETTEVATEEKIAPDLSTLNKDNGHIFDFSNVLNETDIATLNQTIDDYSYTYKTDIAVILTNSLGDYSASDFAEKCYETLYKSSNCILYLINNDTGEDIIYRKGETKTNFTDNEVKELFASTSPLLVTDGYNEAINLFLDEITNQLPEFIIDKSEYLSVDKTKEIDSKIAEYTDDKNISIMLIKDKMTDDDYQTVFERYYTENDDAIILFVNPYTGANCIKASGIYSEITNYSKSFSEAIKSNFDKKNTDEPLDIDGVTDNFIKAIPQ